MVGRKDEARMWGVSLESLDLARFQGKLIPCQKVSNDSKVKAKT